MKTGTLKGDVAMSNNVSVGDVVEHRQHDVEGTVIYDYGNKVVIRDHHAETDDDYLEYFKSDLKQKEI